jgi:hypothetical protein
MPIDFVPSLPIALSLAAAGLLPVAVLVLSHGPLKVTAPGKRFVRAAVLTIVAWVGLMFVPDQPAAVDVIAGGMLVFTALLAGFTLWTLVAWGFTLTMLLTLAKAGRPLTADEWMRGYTGGKPAAAFARDRLGVLLRLGLAEVRGSDVVMVPGRGRTFAVAAGLLRRVFGLPK